ncbi:MAG: hypothetical protein ACKOD9_19055 [Rubrivivax sp.]
MQEQEIKQLAEAVKVLMASDALRRSPEIRRLLDFIARKSAALGVEHVTASLVAAEHFGVARGSDQTKSSKPRVQVSRLRSLLAQFYAKEGRDQRWHLVIPPGRYGVKLVLNMQDQSNFAPRLAVVPFQNLGGGTQQSELCMDLVQELTHLLTQSRLIRVVSLASQHGFVDLPQSRHLSSACAIADFVLEGSVRSRPRSLDLLVQLTDASMKQTVWSQKFELALEPGEPNAPQVHLATKIASLLASPSGVIDRLSRRKPPDGSAYSAVLQFYAYMENYTPEAHAKAKALLLEAVAQAPLYAEAWACLSGVYWNEHVFGPQPGVGQNTLLDEAFRCARHALALAPDCATAHYSLAVSSYQGGQFFLFDQYAKSALALTPFRTDILAGLGVFTALSGRWQQGLQLMDRARDLHPHHPDWYWCPYYVGEYVKGNLAGALGYLERVNVETFPHSRIFTAAIHARKGQTEDALADLSALQAMQPDFIEMLGSHLSRQFPHAGISDLLMQDLQAPALQLVQHP